MTHQPPESRIHGRRQAPLRSQSEPAEAPPPVVTTWLEAIQPLVDHVTLVIADLDQHTGDQRAPQEYLLSALNEVRNDRQKFHDEKEAAPAAAPVYEQDPNAALHTRRIRPTGVWTAEEADAECELVYSQLATKFVVDLEDLPDLRNELRLALIRVNDRLKQEEAHSGRRT